MISTRFVASGSLEFMIVVDSAHPLDRCQKSGSRRGCVSLRLQALALLGGDDGGLDAMCSSAAV